MKSIYFKSRTRFNFSPHPYDIGTLLGLWRNHDDNHFLLKIYSLDEQCFNDYYNYHLSFTLQSEIGSEKDFYRHVWQIVKNRIKHFEQQNPFSSSHSMHVNILHKLQQFQKYLDSIDQFNARPPKVIIAEKEELINQQKKEIEELKKRLSS